jgi:Transposase DDE domain
MKGDTTFANTRRPLMSYSIRPTLFSHVQALCRQFNQDTGLPFSEVLPPERVADALRAEAVTFRVRLFSPLVTLWTFLSQVLSKDHSCVAAVARLLAFRTRLGLPPCSARTGSYCKARQRLPERLLARLVRDTGADLHGQAPDAWRWHGRAVKIVDGSSVSMPDTRANQKAFPQPSEQQPGCGFPVARVVVLLSLACGAVLDLALGPLTGKRTGENALFRTLHDRLEDGDVVLADRSFASYFEIALLRQRRADLVLRLHQRRKADFRRGRRLGREDHVVVWTKPERPEWMTAAQYAPIPATLTIRELRVRVVAAGFRTRRLVVVTTLLDGETFPARELAALYRARWHAELDLRSIKQSLQMDVLRGKTPEMVRKEVWAHLLVYNLIRAAMAQAALQHHLLPRTLSFEGARQTLEAFRGALLQATADDLPCVVEQLLAAIASHRVGDRPDRYEPRVRKRRPKQYPVMKIPRKQARERLAKIS